MAINLLNNSEVAGSLTIRADGTSSPSDSNKLIFKGIGDFGVEITRGEIQLLDDDVNPNGSNMSFKVSDDNGDLQTYITIDGYGFVGIGTATPSQTLEVNGSVKVGTTLQIGTINNASSDTDKFLVSDSGVVKYRTGAEVRSDIGAGTGNGSVTSVTVGTGLDVSNGTTTPNITLDLTEITLSSGLDSTATGLQLDLGELGAVDTSSNTIEKFIIVDDESENASATPADLQTVDAFFKNSQTIINANWSDDTSTTSYINMPLNYIIDSTSSQYYNHFACPTAGTVKYIMMMHVSGTFTGPFTTQLRVVKNGSAAATSGELTPSNASADGSYIEYSPNLSFSKGDRLRFAYSKSATGQYWRGTVASIIIEFENQ